ncbi:hypothetical protein DFH27DRAFT_546816 [Peziza echinospora]|nr:hypothetical protein DFH27DRAFT_546816 [Peziza echinospora]
MTALLGLGTSLALLAYFWCRFSAITCYSPRQIVSPCTREAGQRNPILNSAHARVDVCIDRYPNDLPCLAI